MKIRIKGNSVRLRLTKTEVGTFCKTGVYEEQAQFLKDTLTYRLQAKKGIKALEANFQDNQITVFMPTVYQKEWADSPKVGYQSVIPLPNNRQLGILVEKDFVCLDETVEDQSDNYPNPRLR